MEIRSGLKARRRVRVSIWLLIGCLFILLLGLVFIVRGRIATGGTSSTGTGAWLSVQVFPNQQGWAVTTHDILHTTDDGQDWTNVTPWTAADYEFGGRTDELTSFMSGDQAWLILPARTTYLKLGQTQQPELARSFRTVDGGKTWQSSSIPDTDSTYSDIRSGAGYIGGILNPLQAQGEDRGQTSINSLSAIDGQTAWVSVSRTSTHTGGGTEEITPIFSRIWQSSDGGKSWKLMMDAKPAANGSGRLIGGWASFLNETTGLMVGPTPDTILVSHNSGASWTPQSLPAQNLTAQELQRATEDMAIFWNDQDGILPVRVFLDDQHIKVFEYITHDGAKTWQIGKAEDIGLYGSIRYLDAQNWLMMPDTGTLLRTGDGGATWSTAAINTGFAYVSSLTFESSQEGWAIGRNIKLLSGDQYNQDNVTALIRTTDGGKTWVQTNYTVN